jgi:hypothetical protein
MRITIVRLTQDCLPPIGPTCVGPLREQVGLSWNSILGWTAIVALTMAVTAADNGFLNGKLYLLMDRDMVSISTAIWRGAGGFTRSPELSASDATRDSPYLTSGLAPKR